MAGEHEKDKGTAKTGAEAPRKLDRREVLAGLSTVPALGLFGYAWSRQHQYQQAKVQAASAPQAAPADLQGDQRRPARRGSPGPGADRRDAPHPGPALPRGVRHLDRVQPEARRQQPGEVQARGPRLRGLPRDARQGEGARRGRHRHARLLARAARGRLSQGRQARVLREGDVEHPRGRAQHGGGRPRDRQAPADRPPAPIEPALPPLLREAARRGEAARPDRDRQRTVEPRRRARPRRPGAVRDPGRAAQAVRLQGHAPVPELALVQGPGRRADRGPRLAPDRHLHLVPRRRTRPT